MRVKETMIHSEVLVFAMAVNPTGQEVPLYALGRRHGVRDGGEVYVCYEGPGAFLARR